MLSPPMSPVGLVRVASAATRWSTPASAVVQGAGLLYLAIVVAALVAPKVVVLSVLRRADLAHTGVAASASATAAASADAANAAAAAAAAASAAGLPTVAAATAIAAASSAASSAAADAAAAAAALGNRPPPVTCALTLAAVRDALDRFVVGHALGWAAKAIALRERRLLWAGSVVWEVTEASLVGVLPSFRECWWDALGLDIGLANAVGVEVGLAVVVGAGVRPLRWVCVPDGNGGTDGGGGVAHVDRPRLVPRRRRRRRRRRPSSRHRPSPVSPFHLPAADRAVTPRTQVGVWAWSGRVLGHSPPSAALLTRTGWVFHDRRRRFLGVGGALALLTLADLNAFTLKAALDVPVASPLNVVRLGLLAALGVPAAAQYHEWVMHGVQRRERGPLSNSTRGADGRSRPGVDRTAALTFMSVLAAEMGVVTRFWSGRLEGRLGRGGDAIGIPWGVCVGWALAAAAYAVFLIILPRGKVRQQLRFKGR